MAGNKRRTILIVAVSVGVLLVGTLLIGRAVRLAKFQVYIDMSIPLEAELVETIGTQLSAEGASLELGQPGSPEDVDAILGPLRYSERPWQLSVDGSPGSPVAVDPFLFYPNTRLVGLGVRAPYRGSLEALVALSLRAAAGSGTPAVALAGDNSLDFAAFFLYLSREYLEASQYQQFRSLLAHPGLAEDGALPDYLLPLLARLREWQETGVLARNWTNQNSESVALALMGDNSVQLAFLPRSFRKALSRIEAFGLEPILPPPAEGRLNYVLLGRSLGLRPGIGPSAARIREILPKLQQPDFQLGLEAGSLWSPVLQAETWVDTGHMVAVEGVQNALEFINLDSTVLGHPVWAALRLALR